MQTNTDIQKKAMIEALTKSLGVVTTACRAAGIARCTHYKWYETDPEYRKAVDDTAEIALDFAESRLHKQIADNDTTATIFFLKTKGKKRGYIERRELTGEDGKPLAGPVVNIRFPDGLDINFPSNTDGEE